MLISSRLYLSVLTCGLLTLCSLHAAVLTGVDATIINVGAGADISYLVIDESSLYSTPLEFVYHYTYDSNNPLSGADLLNAISSDGSLNYTTGTFGELESLSFDTQNVSGTPFDPTNVTGVYWSLWEVGGFENGNTNTIPTNSWTLAGVGMSDRVITPGSWDGWTLSSYSDGGWTTLDTPPSVIIEAIPEPKTAPLVLLSLTTLILLLRWNRAPRPAKC